MKDCNIKFVDINLSLLTFELDKNSVVIEILNMDDGKEACTIKINDIIDLKYKNNIDENDILPAYIGELEIFKNIETGHYHLQMEGWIELTLVSLQCCVNYPSVL